MDAKVVWHLCSNRWNSAITEYALSSAKAMSLAGWKSVLSPLKASPCESRARSMGILGESFHFQVTEALRFLRVARALKPDLIVVYGGSETFLARLLPWIPCVRFRGQDKDMSERLPPLSTRMNVSHCAAVLTPSHVLEARFAEVLGRKPVKAVTLGLDATRFTVHPARAARPTLLIVGRLDPIKGHAGFFRLFHELLQQWKGSTAPFLDVIGEAANLSTQQIRAAAQSAGLREGQDWQLIDKRIEDLPARMSYAHIGVVPSLGSEVICRVAEEFLLCGTPIFVSGVGSLEECLLRKDFGASYRGLPTAEAVRLLETLLQASLQESVAQRSSRAQSAHTVFSWTAMGQRLDEALRSFLPL